MNNDNFTNSNQPNNLNNSNFNNTNNGNAFQMQKKTSNRGSNGFGKSIILPFVSGVLGATIVVGVCFSVPGIKSFLTGVSSKSPISSNT